LDYLGENKAILELTDEQIIENIMGNDKEDNVKDDNSILELVSYKDTLKATIILH
jgi:succinate dehydrogenase flavin-adding protein (antitoxin of CptAB toxin-antitoxin module)